MTDLEHLPEVGAAGGEDEPVGAQLATLAAERHVHQLVHLTQRVQQRRQAAVVVVPLEAEPLALLQHLRLGRGGAADRQREQKHQSVGD